MDGMRQVPPSEFDDEDIAYALSLFRLMGLPQEIFHLTGVELADGEKVAMIYLDAGEASDGSGKKAMIPVCVLPTPTWFRNHVGEPDDEISGSEVMEKMLQYAQEQTPELLKQIGGMLSEQQTPEQELEHLMAQEEAQYADEDEDDDEDDDGFAGFGGAVG